MENDPERVAALEEMVNSRYELARAADPKSLAASPLYVVVEKILTGGERLPAEWAVHGTTGYDFMNSLGSIFVDPEAAKGFDSLYRSFAGRDSNYREMVNSNKKMIMLTSLSSEINMLAHQLKRLASRHRRYRDFTLGSLTFALREIIAALPVYRTYIATDASSETRGEEQLVDPRDRAYVEVAVREAKRRNPRTSASIFDFIGDTLLLRWLDGEDEEDREAILEFVHKFQQNTGPVMAKGVEDTTFYNYNRLVSLNEVGGNPGQFGLPVSSFHQQNAERQRQWPYSMVATSTHDTKRGEDVRARIDVLSELAGEWRAATGRWSKTNRGARTSVDGRTAPDGNDEYYLYQTLVGTWPFNEMDGGAHSAFVGRIKEHMLKAVREAKVATSWINQNVPYEEGVTCFVEAILDRSPHNRFLEDFIPFTRKVAHFGVLNSLSQTMLKLTVPGVPDLYQGSELWNLSLVDPDNRGPVDYETRMRMLEGLRKRIAGPRRKLDALARELLASPGDGRVKMYLIHRALAFRRERRDIYSEGAYVPLQGTGRGRDYLCAFARRRGHRTAITAAPRLVVGLTRGEAIAPLGEAVWEDSMLVLPADAVAQSYRNALTGEMVKSEPLPQGGQGLALSRVFATFPVALLERG
jgi:(1->4)-alpha-D-glucan 1-alpha-D-glucosylmutase